MTCGHLTACGCTCGGTAVAAPPLVVTIEESSDGVNWIDAGSETDPGTRGAA